MHRSNPQTTSKNVVLLSVVVVVVLFLLLLSCSCCGVPQLSAAPFWRPRAAPLRPLRFDGALHPCMAITRGHLPKVIYPGSFTGLHSKRLFFYMSGNPESKTSLLDLFGFFFGGVQLFSRQRAPAGHFPLPPHQFFFEIGLWNSTFVAKIHLFRMFRGRHFQ